MLSLLAVSYSAYGQGQTVSGTSPMVLVLNYGQRQKAVCVVDALLSNHRQIG